MLTQPLVGSCTTLLEPYQPRVACLLSDLADLQGPVVFEATEGLFLVLEWAGFLYWPGFVPHDSISEPETMEWFWPGSLGYGGWEVLHSICKWPAKQERTFQSLRNISNMVLAQKQMLEHYSTRLRIADSYNNLLLARLPEHPWEKRTEKQCWGPGILHAGEWNQTHVLSPFIKNNPNGSNTFI